ADAATRDAGERALPGALAPRRAPGADGDPARRHGARGEVSRSMRDRRVVVVVVLLVAAIVLAMYLRRGSSEPRYTGFVEGEERVLRSEVTGRVLEVAFAEGASVPARAVVARLDDADVRSRIDA